MVFFLPTLVMGGLFSHLIGNMPAENTGKAYALNTLGSALAPFVFGLFAIRISGYNAAMQLVTFSYFLLLAWFLISSGQKLVHLAAGGCALLISLAVGSDGFTLLNVPNGWTLKEKKETLMGVLMVTEQHGQKGLWGQPLRRVQVGRHFRMGGGPGLAELRMGHVPLLLKPAAKKALFLGIGTGATLGAVKQYPLEKIDAVEIIPEMLSLIQWFDGINFGVLNDPRITWHASDARRFVSASKERYDVIVADLYHPGRDGAGSLYSEEHFLAVKNHLSRDGIFVQWIPLYQFDRLSLKTVVRTFSRVFDRAHAFMGLYNAHSPLLALVGCTETLRIDWQFINSETENLRASAGLVISDARDLIASYLGDEKMLKRYSSAATVNSDLFPFVLFHAPMSAYEDAPSLTYASFESLLEQRTKPTKELMKFPENSDGDSLFDLAMHTWSAAGIYVDGEIATAKNNRMISRLAVEKYIQAYTIDNSFAAVRGKLIHIANNDPRWKKEIVRALNQRDKARVSP